MKEILQKLGFEHMTGPLWKHENVGIISINDYNDPTEIVKSIYDRGFSECQSIIRADLGIKPD